MTEKEMFHWPIIGREDEEEEDSGLEDDDPPVSVTYETNGNVNPHRIIIRLKDTSATDEGFAINISRSGKATVGEEDEDDRRGKKSVRRRR